MKKRNLAIITVIISALSLAAVGCGNINNTTANNGNGSRSGANADEIKRGAELNYDADAEVEKALKAYETEDKGTKIVRDYENEEPVVSLVFQGMADDDVTEKVLDLLEKRNRKATFFVAGMQAAEDSEKVQAIKKAGHEIGNNALGGESYMESLSGQEIVENLVRSGKIIDTVTDSKTDMALLNSTYYTSDVCRAVKAAGYDKLVSPSMGHYLNHSSFKNYKLAKEYVKRLSGNTIICFKMNGPIEAVEFAPKAFVVNPAKDKQASVDSDDAKEIKVEDDTVITTLTWILDALDAEGIDTKQVSKLDCVDNETYIKDMLEADESVKAEVYEGFDMQEQMVAMTFEGVCSEADYDSIKEILGKYDAGATFFVTKDEAEENAELLKKIVADGFEIGTAGVDSREYENKSEVELFDALSITQREIAKQCRAKAGLLMPRDEAVTEKLQDVAGVLGYRIVNPIKTPVPKAGEFYRMSLADGDVVGNVEAAVEKSQEFGLEIVNASMLIEYRNAIPEIEQSEIDDLRTQNEGKLAKQTDYVRTTERGLSFAFFGVQNKPVTNDVIAKMKKAEAKGTFFITFEELKNCDEQIASIVEGGHEIGIAYVISKAYPDDFDSVVTYILNCQKYMKWKYDLEASLVKMPYGEINDDIKEAISATGCRLIGHEYAIIRSELEDLTETASYRRSDKYQKLDFHRGTIAYVNMNYIAADRELDAEYEGNTVTGELLERVIWDRINPIAYRDSEGKTQWPSSYRMRTVSRMLASTKKYSLSGGQDVISEGKNVLASIPTVALQDEYMLSRYVGNPATDGAAVLPGFSEENIKKIDKVGRFTADPVIFLTFDDWGTDASINHLLYVLEKHGVKASFFIKTQYVDGNPNLLRAIAADGHMIGSHTDKHERLSNYNEVPMPAEDNPLNVESVYSSLSIDEALELRSDIVKSYNKLYKYVGNSSVDGKSSLSTMFRPPTLSISKTGMYQVYDVGYTYCVSGDFSTHDYEAASADELMSTFVNGYRSWDGMHTIKPGSIVVMHMSENAQYTAQVLDEMIPVWKNLGYRFCRLDEYLK